jgi:hypothetical protein
MFGCIEAKLRQSQRSAFCTLERRSNDTEIAKGTLGEIGEYLGSMGYRLGVGDTRRDTHGIEYAACLITRKDGRIDEEMDDMLELTITASCTASMETIARRNDEFMHNMRLDNGTRFAQLHPEQADERTLAHLAIQNRAYRAMLDDLDKGLDAPHADPPIYYSPRTRAYFTLGKLHIAGADMYGDE